MARVSTVIFSIIAIALVGLTVGFNASKAEASTITFYLDEVFSGTPPEAHVSWWLQAKFEETDTDEVTLTMNTGGLVEDEFVGEWFFNFEGDFGDITIDYISGPMADEVDTGMDSFKADGDGYFDILFDFPQDESYRFWAGEESVYEITGTGIDAYSFLFESTPGGDQGTFFSAAHVQGIDGPTGENKDSGWIGAVPIPPAALLLGTGLMGLIAIRRRTFRRTED